MALLLSTQPGASGGVSGGKGLSLKWYEWFLRHVILLVGILFFVAYSFVFLRDPEESQWQGVFVRAAQRLQVGKPIHRLKENDGGYTYPPAMAMFSLPLANLPASESLFGWYLVNVAAAMVTFVFAWRLAGGPPLVSLPGHWQAIFSIGVILAGRFFIAPLENRQFDMVIAALLFTGCYQLWRGREMTGAVWLGASAAMKCTPLLFAPYLIWRGKLKAACLLVVVAATLNLLPDLFWPQTNGRLYIADWYVSVLSGVGRVPPGVWFSDVLLNQSLGGLFSRFTRFALPLSTEELTASHVALSEGEALVLRVLVYSTDFLLLILTAWRFGPPGITSPFRNVTDPGPLPLEMLRTGMEFAAVICLMLLLSPMSSKAHYVVLLLPSLILARIVVEWWSPWVCGLLVALLITGPLTAKGLIGKALGDLTLAWGFPTWFALFSLLGILLLLGNTRPEDNDRMINPAPLEVREG